MLTHELECVKSLIQEAAEAIIQISDVHYATSPESVDRTIVTKADLVADRILREGLMTAFPTYGWLSEETKDDARRFECDRVWIVDPIDGTREFVMRNPEYVVSVALVESGKPVLGVIYNPLTKELYEAVEGEGTRLNGQRVFCDQPLVNKPVVEVSRSDMNNRRFNGYETDLSLVPCGSIAYKLARCAAGQSDSTLSVTPKNEWDIAAGVILVQQARGLVTDLAGQPYVFNQEATLVNGVIAGSRDAYGMIRTLVEELVTR